MRITLESGKIEETEVVTCSYCGQNHYNDNGKDEDAGLNKSIAKDLIMGQDVVCYGCGKSMILAINDDAHCYRVYELIEKPVHNEKVVEKVMEKVVEKVVEKKTAVIRFGECEHEGDLDNYADDLEKSGAKILSSYVNEDAECGTIKIEVENVQKFLEEFKKTDSYCFSNIGDSI